MNRFLHLFGRKTLLHALAVLLVLAQTLVLTHKIAHASQPVSQAIAATASADGLVWNDLFGHDAGTSCDDWNAAFALDANPDVGSTDIVFSFADVAPAIAAPQHVLPAIPAGLCLARAPPRA